MPRSDLRLRPMGVLTIALAATLGLSGCAAVKNRFAPPLPPATADLEQTQQIIDVTQTQAQTVPTIQGVGYAVVSAQPGKSLTHRRLMAIRVARLDAMRELTEKIHGLRLNASTSVADAVIQSDTLRASVEGTIRGARTVRIDPKGTDSYEVILELDPALIENLLRSARASA